MNVQFPSRNSVVELKLKVFAQRRAPFSTHSRYRKRILAKREAYARFQKYFEWLPRETDRKSLHFLRPDFSDLIRLHSFTVRVSENIVS